MDAMFAGHVHAYERSHRVYQGKADACAPTYINIGDGGNREGLASGYLAQPDWSAYREASFGHGILSILNATHASWTWHRDQDDERVVATAVDNDGASLKFASARLRGDATFVAQHGGRFGRPQRVIAGAGRVLEEAAPPLRGAAHLSDGFGRALAAADAAAPAGGVAGRDLLVAAVDELARGDVALQAVRVAAGDAVAGLVARVARNYSRELDVQVDVVDHVTDTV